MTGLLPSLLLFWLLAPNSPAEEPSKEPEAPPPTPARLVELAIERGVPLFNDGQTTACTAVYEIAATALLVLPDEAVPAGTRASLAAALRESGSAADPSDAAWILRRALDRAYPFLSAVAPGSTPFPSDDSDSPMVEDFSVASRADAWRPVNDTVMGGRSRSGLTHDELGTGVFSGEVSLENNGGFASVRRSIEPESLRGFEGIELRVRGDGRSYRFHVSDRAETSADVYRIEFATVAGEWTVVRLPFAGMERSVMGYRPPGSKPLPPERIRSIGLLIGDKQAGPFRLEVDSIRAYGPPKPR